MRHEGKRPPKDALPVLCVTNRSLCDGDFLAQLERIAQARLAGVLLREKDLDEADYRALAMDAASICEAQGVPLVVHSHIEVARELGCRYLHLTLPALSTLAAGDLSGLLREFELSTSCHSVDDALLAERYGCTRIIAGHVYETGCKPGLEARGLAFLRAVCAAVAVPVWAIGGISPGRFGELAASGASGACMMSAFMQTKDPAALSMLAGGRVG